MVFWRGSYAVVCFLRRCVYVYAAFTLLLIISALQGHQLCKAPTLLVTATTSGRVHSQSYVPEEWGGHLAVASLVD